MGKQAIFDLERVLLGLAHSNTGLRFQTPVTATAIKESLLKFPYSIAGTSAKVVRSGVAMYLNWFTVILWYLYKGVVYYPNQSNNTK